MEICFGCHLGSMDSIRHCMLTSSIVLSKLISVCLFVYPLAELENQMVKSPNLYACCHVAVARSSFDGVAICNVLPVLCMMSYGASRVFLSGVRTRQASQAKKIPTKFCSTKNKSTHRELATGGCEVCYLRLSC